MLFELTLTLLSTIEVPRDAVHQDPVAPRHAIRIETHIEPFIDAWFFVRALGSARGKTEVPALLQGAVDAARALDAELQSPLAWGPVEGQLERCHSAAEALHALESVPETIEVRGKGSVKLRAGALHIGDELAKIEDKYRETIWPQHEVAIRAAQKRLEMGLLAKQDACFTFHAASLGVEGLDLAIPCFLVFREPFPGAITHRDEGNAGVCFVAIDGVEGTKLDECVLHEATHAIDIATKGNAFDGLRTRLTQAGLEPGDSILRDAPHTLMFIQSAATIRRVIDPDHTDYGDVAGYYAKVQRVADVERPIWKDYLEGKLKRDEALDKIAALLAKPAAKPAEKR